MFQFRRFPSYTYWFSIWYLSVGFPIRKSTDQSSFAAPRSLSQLITSFIGSWCQGIPLALLLAWSRQNHLRKFRKSSLGFPSADLLPCSAVSPLKSKPASAGLLICALKHCAKLRFVIPIWFSLTKKSPISLVLSLISKNYAGSISEVFKTKLYLLPF